MCNNAFFADPFHVQLCFRICTVREWEGLRHLCSISFEKKKVHWNFIKPVFGGRFFSQMIHSDSSPITIINIPLKYYAKVPLVHYSSRLSQSLVRSIAVVSVSVLEQYQWVSHWCHVVLFMQMFFVHVLMYIVCLRLVIISQNTKLAFLLCVVSLFKIMHKETGTASKFFKFIHYVPRS